MSDDLKKAIASFDAEEEERRANPPPPPKPELEPGQVTVAELIVQLQALPQDAPVVTEGCDCYGPASGAALAYDGTVAVTRVGR